MADKDEVLFSDGGYRLNQGVILYQTGAQYTPIEAIRQLVENGLDAKAKNIWVDLHSDKIIVTDDGHGMVDTMADEDKALVNLFFDYLETEPNSRERGRDPRDLLSEDNPSMKSLEWFKYIAFSPKALKKTQEDKGSKGIGTWAWLSFGNSSHYRTKPSSDLLNRRYGSEARDKADTTFVYIPPTSEDLIDNVSLQPKFFRSKDALMGPGNHKLDQGTRIEVSRLREGVYGSLKPRSLVSQLQDKFEIDLRNNNVKIFVIDRVTAEGRRSSKGVWIEVMPPIVQGWKCFDSKVFMPGGANYYAKLLYDPDSKDSFPRVFRRNAAVCTIKDIEELDVPPLNSGKLKGEIHVPNYSNDASLWDQHKKYFLPGSARHAWVQSIKKQVLPSLMEKIAEYDSQHRERSDSAFSKQVTEAILAALSEMPDFQDDPTGRVREGEVEVVLPPTAQTVTKPNIYVRVDVKNQYGKGVPGIKIVLLDNALQRTSLERTTAAMGSASFGRLEPGDYALLLDSAKGVKAAGPRLARFTITEEIPGYHSEFRVVTEEDRPEESFDPRKIRVEVREFDEKIEGSRPWIQRLGIMNRIDVNKLHFEYMDAEQANDTPRKRFLVALYCASAFVEHTLSGDVDYMMMTQNELTSRIYRYLTMNVTRRARFS